MLKYNFLRKILCQNLILKISGINMQIMHTCLEYNVATVKTR